MDKSYNPELLPLPSEEIDILSFLDELIAATTKLEVYKEKIKDSKLDSSWFMPNLQQKEALASSMMEGTQATLDGVLVDQISPSTKNKNLIEVANYFKATNIGYRLLSKEDFSNEFFVTIHEALLKGNTRKNTDELGRYRLKQNFIGKKDTHAITYTPPEPEKVPDLMNNLIKYINKPTDELSPLIRVAIIHAQFETIHPFMDGNGRVGRMLIPMYLYAKNQIDLPCFFISEALEADKLRYYTLLNNIRKEKNWNAWIKFFLSTVAKQCDKYIQIISEINQLYTKHESAICESANSNVMIKILQLIYKNPIITTKKIKEELNIPSSSVMRYLNFLCDKEILYTDNNSRNRIFICYDLLNILRQ